jgi:hypothetical protein
VLQKKYSLNLIQSSQISKKNFMIIVCQSYFRVANMYREMLYYVSTGIIFQKKNFIFPEPKTACAIPQLRADTTKKQQRPKTSLSNPKE